MNTPQSARPSNASRQLPVARPADRSESKSERRSVAPPSSTRLQAAVARTDASQDFYADVPCTD